VFIQIFLGKNKPFQATTAFWNGLIRAFIAQFSDYL
jgi:hypothetical protein